MPAIRMTTARTHLADPDAAAAALVSGLGEPPRLVLLYASSDRDQLALNRSLRALLPATTRLLGATTGGEIDHDGLHVGSVVIAALSGDFEVGIGLGRELSLDAVDAGAVAMARACAELGSTPAALDTTRCFGLVIDDGLRFCKEELLIGLLAHNPALVLVGGGASSSDLDPATARAFVHVDGEVATDAALIAVIRTDARWAALRSHWYEPSGKTLRITRVDPSCTRALEIDGQPAAARYAELLGVTVDELEFGKLRGFSEHPTGLRVGREYFMRSPWKPLPDGSILFTNLLTEGVELELMRRVDMVASTRQFFSEALPRALPDADGVLLFHCGGRTWTAATHGVLPALSDAFRGAPNPAGMQVHFEIYCGLAINTTLTVLAFGAAP